MRKCGKNIKGSMKSYEEERKIAFSLLDKFIHESEE
jgi:hypothetical protein